MAKVTSELIAKYIIFAIERLNFHISEQRKSGELLQKDISLPQVQNALDEVQKLVKQERIRESIIALAIAFPDYRRPVLKEIRLMNPPEGFYIERLMEFWSAINEKERRSYMWHISQLIDKYEDQIALDIVAGIYECPDPIIRGEIAYGMAREPKNLFHPFIEVLLSDDNKWVRRQAYTQLKLVIVDLICFVEDTRECFYDENRRYQVLYRIRNVLREQLFDHFPTGSTGKSLVTSIINATNRTTAKNFRKKYLGIFKKSLEALRDGRIDTKTVMSLEKKLLEIYDEP